MTLKKLIAILVALSLCLTAAFAAAEGEAPADVIEAPAEVEVIEAPAEPEPEIVIEEIEVVEEPVVEEVVEEAPVEEPVVEEVIVEEAPVEEEVIVEEAPVEEIPVEEEVIVEVVPETPVEEIADEQTEVSDEDIVIIEDEDTPLGLGAVAPMLPLTDPLLQVPAARFTAQVGVRLLNEGAIYFGDTVTLLAEVNGASADYLITWECSEDGLEWEPCGDGETLEFVVDKDNAGLAFRAVAVPVA